MKASQLYTILFCFFAFTGQSQEYGKIKKNYPFKVATESQTTKKNEKREGPNNLEKFNLFSELKEDVNFVDSRQLNINEFVYQDGNSASGYYYFLPNEYNLSWDTQTSKYGINVNYGLGDQNSAGDITVTAILVPDFNKLDWEIAKHLIKKQVPGKKVKELLPIPFSSAPTIEFDNLHQYDVDENDISMRITNNFTDPIYISFRTNRIEELMNIFLNDIGLFGNVYYYPAGTNMPESIPVKFNLKIDSHKTFGNLLLNKGSWRKKKIENKFDFPIVVKYLHALKLTDKGAKIYTWDAGGVEVPEHAQIQFDHSAVAKSIDNDPLIKKLWLEYKVKPCRSCNKVVEKKIDKGVGSAKRQTIEVINLNALSKTNGELMKVYLRSTQASPNSSKKMDLPSLTFNEDGSTQVSQALILQDNQKPDYEYRVKIFLQEGDPLESSWIRGKGLELFFNESALKKIIPDM